MLDVEDFKGMLWQPSLEEEGILEESTCAVEKARGGGSEVEGSRHFQGM